MNLFYLCFEDIFDQSRSLHDIKSDKDGTTQKIKTCKGCLTLKSKDIADYQKLEVEV